VDIVRHNCRPHVERKVVWWEEESQRTSGVVWWERVRGVDAATMDVSRLLAKRRLCLEVLKLISAEGDDPVRIERFFQVDIQGWPSKGGTKAKRKLLFDFFPVHTQEMTGEEDVTLLIACISAKKPAMAMKIVDLGHPNSQAFAELVSCIEVGNVALLQYLIKNGWKASNLSSQHPHGGDNGILNIMWWNVLVCEALNHVRPYEKCLKACSILVQAGANGTAISYKSKPPLIQAMEHNDLGVDNRLTSLLTSNYNPDLDRFFFEDQSVLHELARLDRPEIYMDLVARGANPLKRDEYGCTPFLAAVRQWSNQMVHKLAESCQSNVVFHTTQYKLYPEAKPFTAVNIYLDNIRVLAWLEDDREVDCQEVGTVLGALMEAGGVKLREMTTSIRKPFCFEPESDDDDALGELEYMFPLRSSDDNTQCTIPYPGEYKVWDLIMVYMRFYGYLEGTSIQEFYGQSMPDIVDPIVNVWSKEMHKYFPRPFRTTVAELLKIRHSQSKAGQGLFASLGDDCMEEVFKALEVCGRIDW